LEVGLDDVPHFFQGSPTVAHWAPALGRWLHSHGVEAAYIAPPGDLDAVQEYMAEQHPGRYYILCGMSEGPDESSAHAVVALNGKIVHDPDPRAGEDEITLTGPLVGGRYVAILLSIASQSVPTCVVDMPPLAPARERLDAPLPAGSLPAWLPKRRHSN
jgi:hypothetical protein